MAESNFDFSVDLPEHGWLPCQLVVGDYTASFSASYVLDDPVVDTVTGVLYLLKGEDSVDITWWIEPNYNTLRIDRLLDDENVMITFFENHPRKAYPTNGFINPICCSLAKFSRTIAAAFRGMIHIYGREAYEESTGRLFPESIIDKIYTELRMLAK